jgi:hypothetical protein
MGEGTENQGNVRGRWPRSVQDPISYRAISKIEEEGASSVAANPDLPLIDGEMVTQV